MNNTPNITDKSSAGFSLIEVLVSLALFAIVVTISVGTLVVLMDANAKAQETRELVNQVSLVLDGMTREIRTGYDYRCGARLDLSDNDTTPFDCASGADRFGFTESGTGLTDGMDSNRIGYRLWKGTIQRSLGGGSWENVTRTDGMQITKLRFTLENSSPLSVGDTKTPTVSIVIEGEILNSLFEATKFTLQTTVAQQSLDV